jgi:hypothetical protein
MHSRGTVNGYFSYYRIFRSSQTTEITDQGVTIGEDANTVRLSHAEWNELVRLVKSGELREV